MWYVSSKFSSSGSVNFLFRLDCADPSKSLDLETLKAQISEIEAILHYIHDIAFLDV
jgi:hypothetical protein